MIRCADTGLLPIPALGVNVIDRSPTFRILSTELGTVVVTRLAPDICVSPVALPTTEEAMGIPFNAIAN